jgi:Trp operon repressor
MKVQAKELEDSVRIAVLDALYTAASAVQGRAATKLFLRDLLTESERIMLGRRILIAQQLLQGEMPTTIASNLKVGYDNIYRIQRWLGDQLPGYEQAIKEMEKEFKKRKDDRESKQLYATSVLYRLKKKYPGHFLLLPTPTLKK